MLEINSDLIRHIVNHTFLPKRLPGDESPDLDTLHHALISIASEVVSKFYLGADLNITKTIKMFKTWEQIHLPTERHSYVSDNGPLQNAINNMQNGEMIAMYFKSQNAGLMLSTNSESANDVTVAAFQASCSSAIIMSSPGNLLVDYPEKCAKISKTNLLESSYFTGFLQYLMQNPAEIAYEKSPKAGQSHNEYREVVDPMLITDFIIPSLCNKDSKTDLNFPRVQKKVRDDVVLGKGSLPFRRTGCWMTIKVALQLSLLKELGKCERGEWLAKILYKCIMIQILQDILTKFHKMFLTGDWDLKMQMMAKVAIRCEKIKKMLAKYHERYGQINLEFVLAIDSDVSNQLSKIRSVINVEWQLVSESNIVEYLTISTENIEEDTKHILPLLQKKIAQRLSASHHNGDTASKPKLPLCPKRLDFSKLPALSTLFREQTHVTDFELCEAENWICYSLDKFAIAANCDPIKTIAFQYSTTAFKHYIDDPNAYSKFILTNLKFVQVLDKIAINEFPLLRKHKCGVNLSFIDSLLLRTRSEMQWAQELTEYFTQRDKDSNQLPSLIGENEPSINSFAVKFAQTEPTMIELRRKILYDEKVAILNKLDEVRQAKTDCDEYRRKIRNNPCRYTDKYNAYYERYDQIHCTPCVKCAAENQLEARLKSVKPYERPLSQIETNQYAVVFEMLLPKCIGCLRDVLLFFNNEVVEYSGLNCKSDDIHTNWIAYDGLNKYAKNMGSTNVKLVSSAKPTIVTHYGRSLTVDGDEDSFIKNNGLNHLYRGQFTLDRIPSGAIGSKVIYQISSAYASQYGGMQWAINSTSHTSNEVLAKQSECPKILPSVDFVQFGSLRAGHLLQYRNIIVSLTNGKLSLKHEPVFSLLCQAMWQAGPNDEQMWYRDCHADLLDDPFTNELMKLVEKLVDSNEKLWSDPFALCCLISIVSRTLELTESEEMRNKCSELLRKCRKFATAWIDVIEELIAKALNASEEDKNKLKIKKVMATLAVSLSFSVSPHFIHLVMQDENDVFMWLMAISTLQNEILWNEQRQMKELKISAIQRSLLRLTISTAVMLEPRINRLCIQNSYSVLNRFSQKRWLRAEDGKAWKWTMCTVPYQQVYQCVTVKSKTGSEHVIYIDFLLGKFLVDGCPIGKLPEPVTRHPEYLRVFEHAEFQVQPDKQGSFEMYTTTVKYHDRSYSFQLRHETLIIQEIHDDKKSFLELIPHKTFDSKLPEAFQEKYSHWWDCNEMVILLRLKDFKSTDFADKIFFTLDLQSYELTQEGNKRLLRMDSSTVKHLTQVLVNVESPPYIHVWQNIKDNNNTFLSVELTVLGLKFIIDSGGALISREFPGMQVDSDQSIGSLVGLKNMLVLVGSAGRNVNRKVIIPNGTVGIQEDASRNHQSTSIKLTSRRSPKFFAYEKDDRLRTLVGGRNQSAWLFLASLHGATSSPLPDILTGVTGTEMAFRILQSARVWSCKPYDNESLNILKTITSFVPKRLYYPPHKEVLQKIVWPVGLTSTAAHEGFLLIIDKLIEDSHKLDCIDISNDNAHKSGATKNEAEKYTCDSLNTRHYWRHSSYLNDLMLIKDEFLYMSPPENKQFVRHTLLTNAEKKINNLRIFAHLCHSQESVYYSWMKDFVTSILKTGIPLKGALRDNTDDPLSIETWFKCNSKLSHIRDNWLQLYCFAVKEAQNRNSYWQMLLSAMIIQGIDIKYIYILQLIAIHSSTFNAIIPPEYPTYDCPTASFDKNSINSSIRSNAVSFSNIYKTYSEYLEAQRQHNDQVSQEVDEITDFVNEEWYYRPVSSISIPTPRRYSKIKVAPAETKVNELLRIWYENVQLSKFLERFEAALGKIVDNNLVERKIEINSLMAMNSCKRVIPLAPLQKDLMSLLNERDIEEDKEAREIYDNSQAPQFSNNETLVDHWKFLEILQRKSTNMIVDFKSTLTDGKMGLAAAGLLPRLVPQTLLPVVLLDTSTKRMKNVQNIIGAICVLWTLEQKIIRCINYSNAGQSMEVSLAREKETDGKRFWVPKDYPGWLLLELELNMMIRPIQIKVALEMMSPTSGKNSVMQLNMGEGKTALIVPMLAVALANKNQICRVTVIKSIFETNFNSLRHTLGGLLNRRVYSFPCRRDIKFSVGAGFSIFNSYQECMKKQGLVVTLPEFRLSFQLKGYEIASKKDNDEIASKKDNAMIAKSLLSIQKWLDENTRDILDESDEILTVKYQLIYTMGSQDIFDGGELRWTICQKILKRLPGRLLQLQKKYGDSAIEYDSSFIDNPAIFPHCRLLKTDVYQELIEFLADDFIQGHIIGFASLTKCEMALVKRFLVDNSTTIAEVEKIKKLFSDNNRNWQIILIMAGYLRFQLLQVALVKRWRVNYGVNTKNKFRDMAVPFKAKDVASERTEFGHPDMAIALTQLSYYYSGLNDKQIEQCFEILKKSDQLNPDNEYASWIRHIPIKNVHPSVQLYEGINLDDFDQRTNKLFPMLRKTTAIIDFWLSHLVYPKECKQFTSKITCTAWDLCGENKSLLVTGFSGTNDSKRLLPLPISQNDLQELQDTNNKLEKVLLAPENDDYKALPTGMKSRDILQRLMEDGIKILLDCGALMLELNNEEVADTWLNVDESIEAVIFFNQKNVLTVKTRGGKDCDFELSPFRDMMDKCGVYLDDEHTRGTDLKFPSGSKACVTLGSGLTRDKMVQACMRMRMLESKKHTLSFWASHEVNGKIKALMQEDVGRCRSADVLEWVKWNSRQFEEDGLVYWTEAGVNYCRKRGAEKNFKGDQNNLQKFGMECTEPEVTKLGSMYGHSREMQFFLEIVPRWFESACKSLHLPLSDEIFKTTSGQVLDRLRKIIPEKTFYSQLLDEEQEKELEFELELEIDRELPGKATAEKHKCTIFSSLLAGRILSEEDSDILPICHVFKDTSLWPIIQKKCWGLGVFVSTDFIKVVKISFKNEKMTFFVRPATWVVKMKFTNQLLLISPFEANRLIRKFKEGKFLATLHMYTPRYLPKQDMLLRNPGLCVPSRLVGDEVINDEIETVSPWDELLAPLSLCAGNLYFQTKAEQSAFANFLAIIPKPRNELLEVAFNEGIISKVNGFVDRKHRGRAAISNYILDDAFHSNPQELVEKILRIRHEGVFSADSDVAKLILHGMKTY